MAVNVKGDHRFTVAVLTVGVASFGLLQSMIIPVLSEVQAQLDTDQTTVAWVLTAYLLSAAVATPLIGRIGDSVGKQSMLVVTLLLLAAGSLMAALAPTIGWMIAARVVQGLGGGVIPLAFGIIRDEVPHDKSGPAVGIIAALASGAFGVGIVLAGPIVDGLGYHWLFWIPMIATGLAAVGTVLFIPESPVRMHGRISVLPALLLSGWLVALLLGLSEGGDRGWTSGPILGLFAAAAVLAVGWVLSERGAAVPLIDLDLMRVRGVWTSNIVVMVLGFGLFGSLGFLPQLLQTPTSTGYGFSATITESGRVLLASAVVSFAMGFVTPRLLRRVDARFIICAGTLSSFSAFGLVAFFHDEIWQLTLWMTLQGLGSGLVVSSIATVVLNSVPPQQSGVASGMNANIRMIGGALGSAMMAGVITARTGADGFPLEVGYRDGFLILSVTMLLATAVALLIPRQLGQTSDVDDLDEETAVDMARATP